MDLRLREVKNNASASERVYKPKHKQFFKFKFDCNPFTGSQNIVITGYFAYIRYDPLIFYLMTLKSNHFVGSARYIHVLSLIVIRPSVLLICSQAIFAYVMSPMTFEL